MNFSDASFKRLSLKAGIAMLVFVGTYTIFLLPFSILKEVLMPFSLLGEILCEIGFGLAYLVTFLIPTIVFRLITKKEEKRDMGIRKAPAKETPLIIIAAISIIFACAQINAMMVSSFDFYEYMQEALAPTGPMAFYQILLQIFTTALVPAICEELLFRSAILSSLVPYGKGFAIIASALLFGLMHRNPAQLFYATAAGLVLGYVYVKTRSFWCVFLIHFVNNLLSVIQTAAISDPDYVAGVRFTNLMYALIAVIGFGAVIRLAIIKSKRKTVYDTGSFGVVLDSHDGYVEKALSKSPVKIFFTSPTVLIFTIICAIELASMLFFFNIQ